MSQVHEKIEQIKRHLDLFQSDEDDFMKFICKTEALQFVYKWNFIPYLVENFNMPSEDQLLNESDREGLVKFVKTYTNSQTVINRVISVLVCFLFVKEMNKSGNNV